MLNPIQNKFSEVINARGAFTPLGVSRSPKEVSDTVADALRRYFVMEDVHNAIGQGIAELTGAPAATVVHCTAAAITLSVAACMTGRSQKKIAMLPETSGMLNRAILPAAHAINYGHPIEQAIRLSGAAPVLVGTETSCSEHDLAEACARQDACCLILVSSRLTKGAIVDFEKAVSIAHDYDVPVIIDGAAQDFRMSNLLDTGTDAILVSGQKYLAGPTSGLVLGKTKLIDAIRAQEKGIGRGMKASKEALFGIFAALKFRQQINMDDWTSEQERKVARFISKANKINGVIAEAQPDPTNLPFDRAHLRFTRSSVFPDAAQIAASLRSGQPSIWVMDHLAHQSEIVFELVQVSNDEMDTILKRLSELMTPNELT